MSQFRIKNIDNGIPDEWVYKLNDGVSVVGDDIDARDPNELAEAILDTQEIILKTSSLTANSILKPTSGLAERITILEGIAGNSTLQDIYANGNTISILAGKPLVFGTSEEFRLDENGNLSFKPATMKVKGSGFNTLDFTNSSVTTNLGDLLVGAISSGSKLTLRSESYMYLKDVFLTNPVTLSEPSNTALQTTSQSIIGAINELKSSSFSTTLQSVYAQSSPPRLTTNITQGAVIIEDPNSSSIADALRIIGILNVTKKAKLGSAKIGTNTTIEDTTGYVSSDPITTSNKVATPYISSGTSDLIIEDKRVSFPFTDTSVTDLSTTKKSVIGAINELKSSIDTVGAATTLFNNQHNGTTGAHGIITTQAEIGNNNVKRLSIRNQSGIDTFTVTGSGDMVANSAVVGGLSVVSLLNQLNAHLVDDGTSHSAFSAHLISSNPHNTVKSLNNLTNIVSIASSDSSLNVSTSGQTIDIKFQKVITLQDVYNSLTTKELSLTASGLTIKDSAAAIAMIIRATDLSVRKNLNLEFAGAKIVAASDLTVEVPSTLSLKSTTDNVVIKTIDNSKQVIIQDVPFNEGGVSTIPTNLGTSILGALTTINNNFELSLSNFFDKPINTSHPYIVDDNGRLWPHIPDFHPANEFLETHYWQNQGRLYIPSTVIAANSNGTFFSSGTHNIPGGSGASLDASISRGSRLFPACLSYFDLEITDWAGIINADKIKISDGVTPKTLTASTSPAPISSQGEFKIASGADPIEVKTDKTRNNIINVINDFLFVENGSGVIYLKAGVWGEAAAGYVTVSGTVANNETLTITIPASVTDAITVTLTAKTSPTGWQEFQASSVPEVVAISLAEAINRTMFHSTSATATNGHRCKATVIGKTIKLEWYMPGLTGRLITISSGSANLTVTPFSGGTSKLRIYDMEPNRTGTLTAVGNLSSGGFNISGVASTPFVAREAGTDYFIAQENALTTKRYKPYYVAREIGEVENFSGNIIRLKIKD